jgi:hypothetical protein
MSDIAGIIAASVAGALLFCVVIYMVVRAFFTKPDPESLIIIPVEDVQRPVQGPVQMTLVNALRELAETKRALRNMNESTLKFATTDQYMEASQRIANENPTASPSTRRLKTIALLQKQGVAPLMKRKSRSHRSQ